jgi:putative protein-disulfide isomerase
MAKLLYVVDPMCSWCWGFTEVRAQLSREFPELEWQLVMGGLAPDSDEPMDEATKSYVQEAWRAVAARTGAEFNHDFWTECAPRRSTYPSCRAVIVAGESGKAEEMLAAIQRAYYQEARNPSDTETLTALAADIGLDPASFESALGSVETQEKLDGHFALRSAVGAYSFPSIGLLDGDQARLLMSGWCDVETASVDIRAALS